MKICQQSKFVKQFQVAKAGVSLRFMQYPKTHLEFFSFGLDREACLESRQEDIGTVPADFL